MERREFLVFVSQLYKGESDKLEVLCQLYRIPKDIRKTIKSPITLFFFLDIQETLCLNTLADNLERSGLFEMASFVENYNDKNSALNSNTDNITARIVKILRDGLTLNNIQDLNYLLWTKKRCNEFDKLLIGLLTRNKFLKIDIEYIVKTLKIINQHEIADKLTKYSRKESSINSWENDERKRLMLINFSQKLTSQDVPHLAFLFRLPIGVQHITNPIELFQYLDDRDELNLRELGHHLAVLEKTDLVEELNEYIEKNEEILKKKCYIHFPSIFEELDNCLTKEDLFYLGFLLGSRKYPKTMSDYIIQLVEKGKIQDLDINFLESALIRVLRDDLINIIHKVVVEDQNLESPMVKNDQEISIENQRTQLLEISRNISTEELEKLSIIYNVPPAISEVITLPVELFYYLERESQVDVEYLKMSLTSIQRNDLINILEK